MRRAITALLLLLLPLAWLSVPTPACAQETSCVQCHGNFPGRLGDPVPQWRASIHAQNRVFCFNCHGGDPADTTMLAMSPEKGFVGVPADKEIPALCGQCHVGVLEDYLQSAHGQALGAGGPQCVTCHGNHRVVRATPDLINPQDCSRCHEYGRAGEIRSAVTQTDSVIISLEEDLNRFHLLGFATQDMETRIFELRNRFHRLFHSVDVDRVRAETAGFQEELAAIDADVDLIRERVQTRRMAGGAVVILLVAGGVVASLIRRTYRREEKNNLP
jgi:hypothetical protein